MQEHINSIGQYIKENKQDVSVLDLMTNKINDDTMEYILEVNVTKEGITTNTRDFYEDVVKDALFYQAGRGFMGGGIRLDFYKESKVKGVCNFCEISDKYEQIKQLIESYMANSGNTKGFAIIHIDNQKPVELFTEKFLDKMYATTYKKLKGTHTCHLCSAIGEGYNTAIYKYYTNDKDIYGQYTICKECIANILIGREYIEKYLSTYWIGNNVMFLPDEYNEDIEWIYEAKEAKELQETSKLLDHLRNDEELVLDALGDEKLKTLTDIIFYVKDGEKTFNILHSIQDVLPSRFSTISKLLKEYKLKIYTIMEYVAAVKVNIDKTETTAKERIKIMDSIFRGRKIDRSLFFKRVNSVYKMLYHNDKHKYSISNINRIYNFLCDCRCLEKGWQEMREYKNYQELFDINKEYFDTNEKKAWFILGNLYSFVNYMIRDKKKKQSGEGDNSLKEKTSMDKNFNFSRRFKFEDFIYFSNYITDKCHKYSIDATKYKIMIGEAKDYIAKRENKLSQDEAKYIFQWGIDAYFKAKKEENTEQEGGN